MSDPTSDSLASELIARKNSRPFPFLRGVNFGYLSKAPYYGSSEAIAEIDRMADAGVEWVSLMVMLMQEHFYSTRINRDFRWTPADTDLAKVVVHCQKRGMHVLLKPVIDILDSSGRYNIRFPEDEQQIQGVVTDYWSRWFESNCEAMCHYARLSKEWGVEAFTVGQELAGTDLQTRRWLETIAAVRDTYDGWVCLNALTANRDHPKFIAWVRALDAVGFSNYQGVPTPQPTVEQIRAVIADGVPKWRAFHKEVGIPVYWAECGCRSVTDGARVPWEYRNEGGYDGDLQARYLEGFLDAYSGEPWWAGFQYWKWDEQQNRPQYNQPDGDTGFTVQGKPAEKVIARWCSDKLT
jgi:hypothetical protein